MFALVYSVSAKQTLLIKDQSACFVSLILIYSVRKANSWNLNVKCAKGVQKCLWQKKLLIGILNFSLQVLPQESDI